MEEKTEKLSLSEVLEKLAEQMEDKKAKEEEEKNKKFFHWLPWNAKVGKGKARKNWIIVERHYDNKTVNWERAQIVDNTIMVDGLPRIVEAKDIRLYKGKKPMVIVSDSLVNCVSIEDKVNEGIAEGYGTKGMKLLLARMKKAVIEDKKPISGAVIWIIIAAVIALGYFAFKGGLF